MHQDRKQKSPVRDKSIRWFQFLLPEPSPSKSKYQPPKPSKSNRWSTAPIPLPSTEKFLTPGKSVLIKLKLSEPQSLFHQNQFVRRQSTRLVRLIFGDFEKKLKN